MSETKPPDSPTGFIDLFFDQTEFADPVGRVTKERAMKQIAQLRAKAAAYQEAMGHVKILAAWLDGTECDSLGDALNFIEAEIWAGRFVP